MRDHGPDVERATCLHWRQICNKRKRRFMYIANDGSPILLRETISDTNSAGIRRTGDKRASRLREIGLTAWHSCKESLVKTIWSWEGRWLLVAGDQPVAIHIWMWVLLVPSNFKSTSAVPPHFLPCRPTSKGISVTIHCGYVYHNFDFDSCVLTIVSAAFRSCRQKHHRLCTSVRCVLYFHVHKFAYWFFNV